MAVESGESVVRATVANAARLVEIEGQPLAVNVAAQLDCITVVDDLHLPDSFILDFRDPAHDILVRSGIDLRKRIKISAGSLYSDAPSVLIDGEVTSVGCENDESGAHTIVRGYDLSHRLNVGTNSRVFQNVTYSDIAREIAGKAGLEDGVEATQQVHEYVIQVNETDWEFLQRLAADEGVDCRVDGDTLLFKPAPSATDGPALGSIASTKGTELVWGTTLRRFDARLAAAAQVAEVQVNGWDPVKKEAVVGKAPVTATHAALEMKPADLAGFFGSKTLYITNAAIKTQEAADALAKAKAEQAGGAGYEATAVCAGSAELRAGSTISVAGVNKPLTGQWSVSSTRHTIKNGEYQTVAECSGKQDRSLTGLVSKLSGSAGSRQKFYGVAVGIVTNNLDPERVARVKVKFPWFDDQLESNWARVASLGAGKNHGLAFIPQVGDEVLVAFEHGDMRFPVVLGGLWNGVDKPPIDQDDSPLGKKSPFDAGTVRRSGIVSRGGHRVVFHDAPDDAGIAIISSNEKFQVTLNETTNELQIVSPGKVVIQANELEIKVDANASIKAGGQLTLKGSTVNIN
ncbi:MAG TPA: VgrG-related protein [Candidatus Limnocylindrales bacterium]|nr:VgrG-related protein [Candidatus Limnocylindrales bacterium]